MPALQTLGKHEIRRQLGRGAMGIVYEGWDPIIKRQVAIKTVSLPETPDAETAGEIDRFRREAEAAGRLNHPNIVGVFDYGETPDLAYIVMEFVDGPTLKSLLDNHERFPLPRIARIMEDLLAGLQFSHERGVVHRDIKPANLMLTASGQTKIADFGIARIDTSSMTQTGTVMGTPAYMSPEQFMGQVADARSDIYSSGVLLYQLLTGERPFEGGMASIMQQALNTEAPSPSRVSANVPPQFDAVIKRAMAKDPDARFRSAREFAAAIYEAMDSTVAVPKAAPSNASGETTIKAPPLARPESTERRVATMAPRESGAATGGEATVGRKSAPKLVAAGVAGLVALGWIGYFLLPGSPPVLVAPVLVAPVPAATSAVTPPAPDPNSRKAEALAGAATTPEPILTVLSTPDPNTPKAETLAEPGPLPPAIRQALVPPPEVPSPPRAVPADPVLPAVGAPPAGEPPAAVAPSPVTPVLSPVPSSPVPVPPEQSPLERSRVAALALPCSALNVVEDRNRLRVSGFAQAGPELERFLAAQGNRRGIVDDISRVDQFACAPIEAISAPLSLARGTPAGTFALRLDNREPGAGARLGIAVATQYDHLSVDLYQGDGLVHHLIAGAPREGNNGFATSVAVPGPGPGLIVAIGSPIVLDPDIRPRTEQASVYLAELRARLRQLAPQTVADLAMITIRRAEPAPPPKPRPVESVVAKPAVPRPAALRPAKCSNIVSRAQLGETLTDAELTALRTECRS
jgi:serine/threonine-protein kinase